MDKEKQGLIDIGKLVFAFAKVKRVTLHEDGMTPESDTDHTVMLSVCACALAERLYPRLDLGKVAQFAIIHDLVEAYAGDTDTFNISDEGRKEKEERERLAFERIQTEFKDTYPWIPRTIERYEALDTDEAQFVKMVDKLMTKLTHRINHGAHLKREGKTKEETMRHYGSQTQALGDTYGDKFPEVIAILTELTNDILKEVYV
jgi:putative hydrolase of HD superfamily